MDKLLHYLNSQLIQYTQSTRTITCYIDSCRVTFLTKIAKLFDGHYDSTPISSSSVGRIQFSTFRLYAKPLKSVNSIPQHQLNETILSHTISQYSESGPIRVEFVSHTKSTVVENVIASSIVGRDTKNRKKADVQLQTTTSKFNISVKMDSASFWESADLYFRDTARPILQQCIDEKLVNLDTVSEGDNVYKVRPCIIIPATQQEAVDVIFGSDILGNGCVITKTLTENDFNYNDYNRTLTVNVTNIVDSVKDHTVNNDVYFMIRNDKTRNDHIIPNIKGLRIVAANSKVLTKTSLLYVR